MGTVLRQHPRSFLRAASAARLLAAGQLLGSRSTYLREVYPAPKSSPGPALRPARSNDQSERLGTLYHYLSPIQCTESAGGRAQAVWVSVRGHAAQLPPRTFGSQDLLFPLPFDPHMQRRYICAIQVESCGIVQKPGECRDSKKGSARRRRCLPAARLC